MNQRHTQHEMALTEHAARFLNTISNRTSLITVTRTELGQKESTATIFFTVLPDDQEQAALDFTTRQQNAFKEYLKKNSKGRIPRITFAIDEGDKNRRRIEELIKE